MKYQRRYTNAPEMCSLRLQGAKMYVQQNMAIQNATVNVDLDNEDKPFKNVLR